MITGHWNNHETYEIFKKRLKSENFKKFEQITKNIFGNSFKFVNMRGFFLKKNIVKTELRLSIYINNYSLNKLRKSYK